MPGKSKSMGASEHTAPSGWKVTDIVSAMKPAGHLTPGFGACASELATEGEALRVTVERETASAQWGRVCHWMQGGFQTVRLKPEKQTPFS